jgi:hypothetical protein
MEIFKYILISLVLSAYIPAVSADVATILIGAGKSGGGYDRGANRICSGLLKSDIRCMVKNYDGSEDIVKAIVAGELDYGFSQPDVPYILNLNPQRTTKAFLEVGALACNNNSDVDELSDVNKEHKIEVGPIGSGGALTWDGIIRSEKEGAWSASGWIEAAPQFNDLADGLLNVEDGESDCIFAVAQPDSETFKSWAESGLVFSDIDDGDVDDLERNGEPVYPIEVRDIAGSRVEVIVLPASIYRSVNAEAKSPQALALIRRLARSLR